jgi:CheY-like chemotaxis protein
MRNGKPVSEKLVLVVDDDSSVRESLSSLLAAEGYSVMKAENGLDALAELKGAPHFPFVILLDLAMPVMDGRRFLQLRAADPMLRRIPVVVISGNPSSGEPLDGIDTYLRKPVEVDRLMKVINCASTLSMG